MKIEKILESVYIEEWETTAMILEDRVVVYMGEKYMDINQFTAYVAEKYPHWITNGQIKQYEELYELLENYAKNIRQ